MIRQNEFLVHYLIPLCVYNPQKEKQNKHDNKIN